MKAPSVSILVPVYNSGEYLRRFIESVVQQSFEDYELICVDNWSTDNSVEILNEYKTAFPDKIFIYKTDEHGDVGKGRNTAFAHARGEYVFWCDSDDIIHPFGLERLYTEAKNKDADVVAGWAQLIMQDATGQIILSKKICPKKTQTVNNDVAIMSGVEFWVRLIRKELIEQIGPMREDLTFDDVSYLPVIHSYAKKICYVDYPIYYYFRRVNSTCTRPVAKVSHDSVNAERHALENCNPEHRKATEKYVADRILGNLNGRWQFTDVYVDWVKELMPVFEENELIITNRQLYKHLKWAEQLTDDRIPNIIYVPGFGEKPTEERLAELNEQVFHDGAQVVVLSEETCDVDSNEYVKAAYKNGNFDLVNGYFALQKIYEQGGIYLHKSIKILNYFNIFKFYNTFFSYLDKNHYSDRVFGAPAGSRVIKAILDTYSFQKDKKERFKPLSERIACILLTKYDIPLDGRNRPFSYPVSTISADLGVVDTRFGNNSKRCVFEHDLSEFSGTEGYVTVSFETLQSIIQAAAPSRNAEKNSHAEKELNALKQSNTYKIAMKLRKIGDGPMGPFLKKLFRGFMKIRNKIKRK